jgi:uncharacterized protein
MTAGDPLLLEDVLVRHPRLRLYVMHAGWPRINEMIALMHAHPQVHVDVGVINWYLPEREFYAYFQRLVDAGRQAHHVRDGPDDLAGRDRQGDRGRRAGAVPLRGESPGHHVPECRAVPQVGSGGVRVVSGLTPV